MVWHDNYVHGLAISEGKYGSGELILDLDYIVEWIKDESGTVKFKVAPATLTFREVTDLTIALDYASANAAMGPFSIGSTTRCR